jgi:DNA-nicking Smr family endonuclease
MKDKLTPEELHLWKLHMKDVKPLSRKVPQPEKPSAPKIRVPQKPPLKRIAKSPPSPVSLQAFGRKNLRHLKVDARLDMHGMTLEGAYQALEQFLVRAQERGFKTVLVITGKGALSAENTLRHQMPRWLEETHLRHFITGFHHPAKPQDGGPGAFYVGVRRIKKSR